MFSTGENRDALTRLQMALEAVSADLDAIEGRPHLYLRHAAVALGADEAPRGLNTFVDQFALALQRSTTAKAAS